jgi:anti-sigma factor RsiW
MNALPGLQLLGAYMDDSLDESQRLAVRARLAYDAAWREQLQDMRLLRAAVQANAQRYRAPQTLRARIYASAQPRASATWHRFGLDWRRLASWGDAIAWRPLGVALSVVTLTLSVVNIALWQPAREQRLMQAAVTSHLQATTARPLVDVSSSDRATLQPWLAERLGFPVPVAVPPVAQVTLVGARLDGLDGRPVAAVVYRLHDHVVHAFIWRASDDSATITSASMRGLSVDHWSRGGRRYCVVSDLPQGQLLAFAQSLAEADDVL